MGMLAKVNLSLFSFALEEGNIFTQSNDIRSVKKYSSVVGKGVTVGNMAVYHSNSPWPLWNTYLVLLAWYSSDVDEDSLFSTSGQDAVLQRALPLVLYPLHLVIRAEHDLAHRVFRIVVLGDQVVWVVEIGVDGVLVVFLLLVVATRSVELSPWHVIGWPS